MLHDDQGLPLFYPTLFSTSQLRNAGVAVNTARNKLSDIVVFLRWEAKHRRDLAKEFSSGCFLSIADVESIRDFAKLDMREYVPPGELEHSTNANTPIFLEARISSVRARPSIGGHQHYNRLSTIADYLEFVASVVTQHKSSAKDAVEIARMARTIRKHRPKGLASKGSESVDERSPPSELVERFMSVGAFDHAQNPFRDPGIRLRNAIIFGLLRHTGMRRGELLSLCVNQFDLGDDPRVWIRRTQDDAHDSRPYQPVAKTKERQLALPEALAEQIHRYIMTVRTKIPPARIHPYLLVSHRNGSTLGRPLSLTALSSRIFPAMRKVDSELEKNTPACFPAPFQLRTIIEY